MKLVLKRIQFSKVILINYMLLLLIVDSVNAQQKNEVLANVINKYSGKWPKTLSFSQTTTLYRPTGEEKQKWYEVASFPDKFRIDFNMSKGNSVIFNNNQEYYFRENKLSRSGVISNPLIYLLGGMYFDSLDTVKHKLTKLGINTNKQDIGIWKNKSVFILGALDGDTTKTQLWFDSEELYLIRFVNNTKQGVMDVHFTNQQKIGNTWHEMAAYIFQNGKLVQKEEYADFKTNIKINQDIFDPNKYGQIHWLK